MVYIYELMGQVMSETCVIGGQMMSRFITKIQKIIVKHSTYCYSIGKNKGRLLMFEDILENIKTMEDIKKTFQLKQILNY